MMDPFRYETLELPDPGTRFETDTVIVSSLTDDAHDNVALAKGNPRVINALDVTLGKDDATIDKFLAHRSQNPVLMVRHHTVEFPIPTPRTDRPMIIVLDPSGYQRTG